MRTTQLDGAAILRDIKISGIIGVRKGSISYDISKEFEDLIRDTNIVRLNRFTSNDSNCTKDIIFLQSNNKTVFTLYLYEGEISKNKIYFHENMVSRYSKLQKVFKLLFLLYFPEVVRSLLYLYSDMISVSKEIIDNIRYINIFDKNKFDAYMNIIITDNKYRTKEIMGAIKGTYGN